MTEHQGEKGWIEDRNIKRCPEKQARGAEVSFVLLWREGSGGWRVDLSVVGGQRFLLTLQTLCSQSLGGTAGEQPPASKIPPAFFRTSHNHRAKQPTTTFPHQNTFSSSISTQLVKLTQGNIMDGFLTGNYVVRCKSFLKRGLLK